MIASTGFDYGRFKWRERFLLHTQEVVMKRIKMLVTLVLLAMAGISGAIGNGNNTLAADYSCHTTTCPGVAQCSGDRWAQTGNCAITCYKDSGAPGQIVFNGSANCSPPSSGGNGDSAVGFNSGDGGSSYCEDNWWWDSKCSGPYDTTYTGKIS
jgi:hypothetical protein